MDTTYKLKHEEFVSQNNGTSPEKVILLCSVMPVSNLLLQLLLLQVKFNTGFQIGVEITILVIPTVLAFTVFSDYVVLLIICLSVACLCLVVFIKNSVNIKMNKIRIMCEEIIYDNSRNTFLNKPVLGEKIQRAWLTDFRCQVLTSTVICILAVDFCIFPRSFAKTEKYGWSLMDTGIGCFILVNANYSGHSRGIKYVNKLQCLNKALKSCLPLLLIGIARMLIIKFIGYHEHISEYGIHWNFFMSLALTKIFCTIILLILPHYNSGCLSFVIATTYQYILSNYGLNNYLFSNQRENFFQANKEGIYSLLGYISLYFAGIEMGKYLFKTRDTVKEWIKVLLFLWTSSFVLWIFMNDLCNNIEQVSRRTANLPYCLWMLCFLFIFAGMYIINYLILEAIKNQREVSAADLSKESPIIIWNSINNYPLFYFLFANILTGLINITIQTIYASTISSLTIIIGYVIILSISVISLNMYFINFFKSKKVKLIF